MTPWQRRLRGAIAIFGLAFAAVVFFAVRHPKPPPTASETVARLDPDAAVESRGGQILRFRGGREDVEIEFEGLLTYGDGRQKGTGVRIVIKKRGGRDVTVTGKEAEVGKDQSRMDITGDVTMVSTDGMEVHAPEASYDKAGGVVRAAGHVTFARQRLSGTSTGLTYRDDQDLLEMPADVVLRFAGERGGVAPMDVTAGSAVLPRPDRYIRFERGFRLVHEGRTLESDSATAFLSDDESRVEMLEMRGHSRITGMGETAGALRAMTAQDINLEFAADGRTLAGATLSRDAAIEMAGNGAAGRRIAGGWISLVLAPDGTTVVSLVAREPARMDLPKDGAEPARTITAASLVGTGAAGTGLTAATFSGDVEYREQRPPTPGAPNVTRVARSRVLDLVVQPGFGTIDDARFSGAVRFEEDNVRASGALAKYLVKAGVLELEGVDETTGQMPQVADEQVTIEGQQVQLTMEGRKIVAKTDVRSAMRGVTGTRAGGAGAAQAKRPSMLKSDQPVYAAAATLTYDGTARLAVYDGGARVWQGDTAIQGDRVTLDDATGNLTSRGHARSTFMLEQRDEKTKKTERVATIASADDLLYEEALRRATYTTSARLSGQQGDLRATKIELYLKPSGNELERAEGYEKVTLRADGRQATGDRLTYFAADAKYVMVGAPVRIVAECRETTGRTLTFFRSVDTISVDGDDEIRTQTKGGPTCGDPRVK